MELSQLKTLFDAGALNSAVVTPVPMKKGYMLIFSGKGSKSQIMTAQRSNGKEPRVFKSIDAAVSNATKVGFRNINVQM